MDGVALAAADLATEDMLVGAAPDIGVQQVHNAKSY